MYPLGVYLARYIDWWYRRVANAPFLWMIGIIVAGNFFQFLTIRHFGSVLAWVLPVVGLALLPGLWASFSTFSKKINLKDEAEEKQEMAKKLINEYAKKSGRDNSAE
ncbi:hypothetical protein [Ruegeria sp.]|uniref:hypothetical protein n=1 Tax=Ruegeria sp. TaxID=1879320 RepID=UPI002322CCC9|nr:hypothetical protein [Ruegeria sp.]MDA7965395.1 hypothetical protein [Ruegeria sp.]